MYGMIHRGIRQMVIDSLGNDRWEELEREIGFGPAEQISLAVYDDKMTWMLLAAAADRLGYTVPECLRHFGRYWIDFAERGSHGSIMSFLGDDLGSFVSNLDRMHQAVVAAMPGARVPSFSVIEEGPGMLRIRYISERDGLEHFVIGLFHGVLERFAYRGEVKKLEDWGNAPQFLIIYETT